MHEEHDSGVKKISAQRKTLWNQKFLISKGFSWSKNFFNAGFVFLVHFYLSKCGFYRNFDDFWKNAKKFRLRRGLNLRPLDPLKTLTPKTHWAMVWQSKIKLPWKWTIVLCDNRPIWQVKQPWAKFLKFGSRRRRTFFARFSNFSIFSWKFSPKPVF